MDAPTETHYEKSRIACRRKQQEHRDELIAELGWEPEGLGKEAYVASTRELVEMVNERRVAAGQPLATHHIYTVQDPRFA